MLECSFCGRRAVHHQRYSGVYRCDRCFKKNVERRFRRTVANYELISPGDRVAVAVSGGSDSLTQLYLLSMYCERRDIELLALTIDEGIEGYRDESIPPIQEIANELAVKHVIVSFREVYGASLDKMASLASENGPDPCTCCGLLRRSLLNRSARELGADKLAIAHNLDDEVQTIMLNYIRGDLSRMKRVGPITSKRKNFVPRIKPLREVPEKEVAIYAMLQGLNPHWGECPYVGGLRSEVRDFLNGLELEHPTTKYQILRTFGRIQPHLPSSFDEFEVSGCRVCGEPTSNGICRACQLLEELGLEPKKKEFISKEKEELWRRARLGG